MTHEPLVAAVLAARPDYRMPLTQSGTTNSELAKMPAKQLFPNSRLPGEAKAGLMLYLGCWTEAHQLSQDLDSNEGNFWHAIVHRQEPDPGNSQYWFKQVGKHPVFGSIQADSLEILEYYESVAGAGVARLPAAWNPVSFVDFCEAARRKPGSPMESAAIQLQHAEWLRLFEWCAQPK